ncbi:restriction endonuclease subunit S [Desulfosarcina ovata]|uniref:Type I restriction modification DNA specificity domain-containing protein n=1 Tax=Desulfosarcina ovata subsp. ovata TaxID=2752305 RepID=A0A5K8AE27_9BACT|nr:restriction endonuclease subunit S [Desulfosarcina ovata]BBO90748.1 hypothetical protein DSCOOX_39280 [Desulfosarcina ovata subsp. ovata]
MRAKLKEIASIQMGYSFRSRLDFMNKGLTAVIQMKDLTDDNVVDCRDLIQIDMDSLKDRHLARLGDIVFRSRGLVTTAVLLSEDPGQAVIAAPLIKIRVDEKAILPDYLVWYINQPLAQAYFTSRAKGTTQKMISKQTLENVEISVPSLDRQQAIVDIAALADKEQVLLEKIAVRRNHYVLTKLMQFVEKAS